MFIPIALISFGFDILAFQYTENWNIEILVTPIVNEPRGLII